MIQTLHVPWLCWNDGRPRKAVPASPGRVSAYCIWCGCLFSRPSGGSGVSVSVIIIPDTGSNLDHDHPEWHLKPLIQICLTMSPHPVKDVDMERKEELILAKQLRAARVTILPKVRKMRNIDTDLLDPLLIFFLVTNKTGTSQLCAGSSTASSSEAEDHPCHQSRPLLLPRGKRVSGIPWPEVCGQGPEPGGAALLEPVPVRGAAARDGELSRSREICDK